MPKRKVSPSSAPSKNFGRTTGNESILEEANRLTRGDRNADYGHPLDDWTRTAKIWSAVLGVEVTAEQAVLCMVGVKLSRECHRPKRDNRTDMAGYADCLERIAECRAMSTAQPVTPQ